MTKIEKSRDNMKDITSNTWKKMMEIPADVNTLEEAIAKIKAYTDFCDDWSTEDFKKAIKDGYIEFAADGIIIWAS